MIIFKRKNLLFVHFTLYIILCALCHSCKTYRPVAISPPVKDSISVVKPVEEKKEETKKEEIKELKIGLLMPFNFSKNLDPSVSDLQQMEIDPTAIPAIEFYEGAKMAADSMMKKLRINFNIFDASLDSISLMNIIKGEKLYENDVLITSLGSPFNQIVAEKAEKRGKKIILTQPGNINPASNTLLATASTNTQCKTMAKYLAEKFGNDRILIFYRDVKREIELADFFYTEIDSIFRSEKKLCDLKKIKYTDQQLKSLIDSLDLEKRNLVIIPSSDESFVSPVLNTLNDTLNYYRIIAAGLPTWENFESVELPVLQNLQVHIFSGTHLGLEIPDIKKIRGQYLARYKTDPLFNGYQGFFLTYYLSGVYLKYEKEWWEKISSENVNEFSFFSFNRIMSASAWENQKISILKFENFQLTTLNK